MTASTASEGRSGANPAAAGVERLLLLGCGRMGGALLEGWLAAGLAPSAVTVIEPAPSARLETLAGEGLALNPASPALPTVALIAVKPQKMAEALPGLGDLGGALAVSIAAGTPIRAFEAHFGATTPIVRAMPNTPSAIGRGISALVANGAVTPAQRTMAETLMQAVGETVWLEHEGQMDAVTGLSGSGPAYVFHLIEAMAKAGEAEGLDADLAMRLARATVTGAGALADASGDEAAALRVAVTSPGGTTAAGLEVLMGELPDLMRRTVAAAAARGRALSE